MAKDFGFTIAEVLITLGIVGVVAALTMPSLIAKYKEKQTVTAVKKAYSILSQAYLQASLEYGTPDKWGVAAKGSKEGAEIGRQFLFKYIDKVADGNEKSYTYDVKTLYGTIHDPFYIGNLAFVNAKDGMNYFYYHESLSCNANWGTGKYANICAEISADINGKAKPNTVGIDIFKFYLTKEGIVPFGSSGAKRTFEEYCNKTIDIVPQGWGCTAWVMYNENMDYLHCSDLSWDGKRKCN